jgi:hypothetical protein
MRDCRFVFPSIIGDEDEGSEDDELVHGRENLSYFILNKDKGMNKINLLNKLIYKIPNSEISKLSNDEFKVMMSIIPTAKVCQSILEMDEIQLVSKINMIPVHILKIIIGNLSTEKFNLISTCLTTYQLSSIINSCSVDRIESLLLFNSGESADSVARIRIIFENLTDFSGSLISSFDKNIIKIISPILDMRRIREILPYFNKEQVEIFFQMCTDVSIIEFSIYLLDVDLVKVATSNINLQLSVEILGEITTTVGIGNSDQLSNLNPTFLQMCLGITTRYTRLFLLFFLPRFNTQELSIIFSLLPESLIGIASTRISINNLLEIVDNIKSHNIKYIVENVSEEFLPLLFVKLNSIQIGYAVQELSPDIFLKVLLVLSTDQLYAAIPSLTFEQKEKFMDIFYNVDEDAFPFYIHSFETYHLAIAVRITELRHLVLGNFSSLSRKQIWIITPLLRSDDIISIIPTLDHDKISAMTNNIKYYQKFSIITDLEKNIKRLHAEIDEINKSIIFFSNIINDLEKKSTISSSEIVKIQKINMNISKNYIQIKEIYRIHEHLYYLNVSEHYFKIWNAIKIKLPSLSIQVHKIKKKIDSGDGMNGLVNKRIKKSDTRENMNFSIISENIDNSECFDTTQMWIYYNNVREALREGLGEDLEDELDEIDISWEDLIECKLFSKEDYEKLDIESIADLKQYIISRNESDYD